MKMKEVQKHAGEKYRICLSGNHRNEYNKQFTENFILKWTENEKRYAWLNESFHLINH